MNEKKGAKTICRAGLLSLLAAGLLAIWGCATLNRDECVNADWRGIGYEDGAKGYKASRIGDHRKACAEHGVTPDFEAYETGRQQGLAQWCTPYNAYVLGANGGTYNGVCPKALEPAFLEALHQGKAVHAYASQINIEERQLKARYAELDAKEKTLADMESELISDSTSPLRRKKLLQEIRLVENDRNLLLNDIADTEHAIAQMQDSLARMRSENPFK